MSVDTSNQHLLPDTRYDVALVGSVIYSQTEQVFLDGLLRTFRPLSNHLLVFTGNYQNVNTGETELVNVVAHSTKAKGVKRILQLLKEQIKLSIVLVHKSHSYRFAVFHAGEYRNLIPFCLCKIMQKRTIFHHFGGNKFRDASLETSNRVLRHFIPYIHLDLQDAVYRHSDVVVLEAYRTISWGGLRKHQRRIAAPLHPEGLDDTRDARPQAKSKELDCCFVGRLSPKRKLLKLIESIPILVERHPDFHLTVVGRGPLLDSCEKQVKNMNLSKHVTFIPFIESLDSLYTESSFLIFPSSEEGIPHVIIEAMYYGLPVIASPVGAIPEVIVDGNTGFLLRSESPESMGESLLKAFDYTDLEAIKSNAHRLVMSRYGSSVTIAKYARILEKLSRAERCNSSTDLFFDGRS